MRCSSSSTSSPGQCTHTLLSIGNGGFRCLPVSIASRWELTLNLAIHFLNMASILIVIYGSAASVVLNSEYVRSIGCFSMFLVSFRQDSEYWFWSKVLISDRNLLISSTFRSHCFSNIFSTLMDCNTSRTVEHQVLWFDWWSCNNSLYIICSGLSGCNPNRRHQNLINNSFCRISRG